MSALADDGDVGNADAQDFGSVELDRHGHRVAVNFLMNHEVAALLDQAISTRELGGEKDPVRLRQTLLFCKNRTDSGSLSKEKLVDFSRSVRQKLSGMVDGASLDADMGDDFLHLSSFEIAQLINLIDSDNANDPNDPASSLDECLAVIPSLKRFGHDFLVKEVLATLKRERDELKLGPTFAPDAEEDEDGSVGGGYGGEGGGGFVGEDGNEDGGAGSMGGEEDGGAAPESPLSAPDGGVMADSP